MLLLTYLSWYFNTVILFFFLSLLEVDTYLILTSQPTSATCLQCETREPIPTPVISSINRRTKKATATASTPLSQKWYRNKQQHVSKAQKLAIRNHWPIVGIDLKYGVRLNPIDIFNHRTDINTDNGSNDDDDNDDNDIYCVLDIGFGTGDSIVQNAVRYPQKMYIGCEIHRSGIGATILKILQHTTDKTKNNITNNNDSCIGGNDDNNDDNNDNNNDNNDNNNDNNVSDSDSSNSCMFKNIRLIRADAHMLLSLHLVPNSINEVCIYFPDPWINEERDINRRIIRHEILELLSIVMKDKGILKIVTDVDYYADHCRNVMKKEEYEDKSWHLDCESIYKPCQRMDEYDDRPVTKYEIKAAELGHMIYRFDYRLYKDDWKLSHR